ncbi:MAG: hypothetical protein RJA29_2972 [Pseudomonadota bacterium]
MSNCSLGDIYPHSQMSLVYRCSRCDPLERTEGNPSIHAEKQRYVRVNNWWSSQLHPMCRLYISGL